MKHFYFFTNRVTKSFRALALVAFVLLGTATALAAGAITVTSSTVILPSGTTTPAKSDWKNNGAPATYPTADTDYSISTYGTVTLKNAADYNNANGLQVKADVGYLQTTIGSPAGVDVEISCSGTNGFSIALTGATTLTAQTGVVTISTTNTSALLKVFKNTSNVGYIKYIKITPKASSTPTITVSPSSLSGFTYVQGSGPSATKTFTVSGANLTANISLSAPTNYEISLSSGSGYTTSLTLTQSGGTVSSTTIYARLKSGLSTGTYNSENITATSTGATNQTVSCSGSVTVPPYTVTFNAGTGSCGTASLTEASGGAGVTLPTASPSAGCAAEDPAWVFAGWATASQTETTSAPTLYTSGSTYKPSANVTLYAVYKQTTDGGTTDVTESYGFETGDSGWTVAVASQSTTDVHSGTYSGKIGANGAAVKYNTKVATPKSFTFWLKKATTNNNYEAYIEVSSDGSSWTKVGTYAMSEFSDTEWRSKTADLSSYSDVYVRFSYYGTTAIRYVDDVSVTHTVASSTTTYNSNPNCCTAPSTALSLSATSPLTLSGANVSTAITVTGGNGGTVNYTVDPSSTGSMSGNTFTATATGTYTITGTQALNGSTCGGSDDVTIVVNPAVTYSVSSTLTGCTVSPALPATVDPSTPGIEVTVTPNSCYTLPASISVTMGGTPLTLNTDYLWDTSGADNLLIQPTGGFSGNIVITITATAVGNRTITYNTGLSGVTVTSQSVACGSSFTVSNINADDIVCEENKGFAGWSTSSSATSVEYEAGATVTPTGDMTLYGVWYTGTISNNYKKITTADDVTDGDYIVGYNYNSTYIAMTNTEYASGQLTATEVTPSSDIITTTDNSIIWKIQKSGGNYTIKNEAVNKYANISGSNLVLETTSSNYTLRVSSGKFYFTSSSYELLGFINASGNYFFARSGTATYNAYLYKRQSSVTYSTTATCTAACSDALDLKAVLTATADSVNLNASGTATATLTVSKSGTDASTAGKWTVTCSNPDTTSCTISGTTVTLVTSTVGVYPVIATFTPTNSSYCPRTARDTISVFATPVVTIVDASPVTFSATCGATDSKNVTVTGYNLGENTVTVAIEGTDAAKFSVSPSSLTPSSGAVSTTVAVTFTAPTGAGTGTYTGKLKVTCSTAKDSVVLSGSKTGCEPVTITFYDYDGNDSIWTTKYAGDVTTLPEPKTGGCGTGDAAWTFQGWTARTSGFLTSADIIGTAGDSYTVSGDATYYAVYAQGATGNDTIFSDNFSDLTEGSTTITSRTGWDELTYVYPGNSQARVGNSSKKGIMTTNEISEMDGEATLSFDLTTYGSDAKDVVVTINNGTVTTASTASSTTTNTATFATTDTKTRHTMTISGTYQTTITFAGSQASKARFYLDSVMVTQSVGNGYTFTPACCDINLTKPVLTTTTAANQITVSWPAVQNAQSYTVTHKLKTASGNPATDTVAVVSGQTSYSKTWTGLTDCSYYIITVTADGDPNATPSTICSSVAEKVEARPGASYIVNFNYGNGTGTPSVWVSGCGNGTSVNLPAVTPNSMAYTFAGWYTADNTKVGDAGDAYTPTANITLYAKYTDTPKYTITFVNGATEVASKDVYSTDTETNRTVKDLYTYYTDYGFDAQPVITHCEGFEFVGWTLAAGKTPANGTTTKPTVVTFPCVLSKDTTVYALWKETVTDGGGSATYVVTGTSSTTATITPSLPSGATLTYSNTYGSASQITKNNALTITISGLNTSVDSIKTNMKKSSDGVCSSFKLTVGTTDVSDATVAPTTTATDYMFFNGRNGSQNADSGDITLYLKASASSLYLYNTTFYVKSGTTTYYSVPKCDPEVNVPEVCALGTPAIAMSAPVGGSESQSYTAYATNIDDSGTKLYWTLTGTGKSSFSLNWKQVYLAGGAADSVFVLTYTPVSTLTATATLQFFADDTASTASCDIALTGTTCTAPVLSAASTTNTITIASTKNFGATDTVYVWNNVTSEPEGGCGVFPFDSIYCKNGTAKGGKYRDLPQGVKTFTIGSTRLYQGSTYSYRGATGNCDAAVKTITTKIPTDAPVLTVSPTLWETVAEANRDSTSTTITLTGSNMNSAQVTYALTGASAFTVVSPTSPITLSASGGATVTVKYKPTKAETSVTYLDFSYLSSCETKTVRVTLIGNVPGIDIVEVNPDASGFTLHTDLEGTPNIVLSQEVEHQGDGRQANDLFFSKYFEAAQNTKLLGLYNGTNDTISLRGIRIAAQKAGELSGTKAALWSPSDIISLDTLKSLAPGKEIILFTTTGQTLDKQVIDCVSGSTGWEHEGWYPVNNATAKAVYGDESRNLFKNGTYENKNAGIVTSGDKVYGLQRKAVDGTWEFIDVIGAFDGDSVIGRQIKPSSTVSGMDAPGWACLDGTNYLTKETAGLSTNRHLLIRKNTVVDGLNALEQNTEDFATLCTEWEGLIVPKNGAAGETEQDITCRHFGEVSTFNYDGYYASFERIDDNLVTFTAATGRPGDWVGSFLNPTETFQDSLRCYNLKISVERYYDSRDVPPTERSKEYVQNLDPIDDAAEIAALDTVEVMSTQYKVPIIVKTNDSITTKDGRFIELSKDTCSTCDVVILNKGILTKSSDTDDRDSVRTVYVYKGGRLVVPGNLNYAIQNLHIRAEGDSVGSAYIQGNLKMQQARIYHDKRIDNTKYYFFALPYSCAVSKITEMNGKTLGVYGTSWAIKYYDGLSRIENHGLESNWKLVAADATLEAGRGYVLAISSDIKKFVRFPLVTEATFTENTTAKTLDVTMYGNEEAVAGTLGYNNVGWNLVGNPYIAHFTSAASGNDGVNNGTVELGGYYQTGNSAWNRLDTEHIYVTVPNANNVGYTQARASETKLSPFISFFVQAQATGSLTFATTSRKQAPIVAAGVKSTTVDQTNTIALNLTVGAETDRTTFILNDDYITGYEIGSDLLKWKGTWAKLPYFYSFDEDNNPLAYNAVPYSEAKKQMPLGFYMPTKYAPYKFSIDRSRSDLTDLEHVYLLRKGSVVADLLLNDYSNTDIARMAENKEFAISIQRSATVITPVAETVTEGLVPYAWIKGHEMRIEQVPAEGQLVILDAVGRAIEVRTLTGNHVETFTLRSDGVYAVSITTPQNQYILKVVTQ